MLDWLRILYSCGLLHLTSTIHVIQIQNDYYTNKIKFEFRSFLVTQIIFAQPHIVTTFANLIISCKCTTFKQHIIYSHNDITVIIYFIKFILHNVKKK